MNLVLVGHKTSTWEKVTSFQHRIYFTPKLVTFCEIIDCLVSVLRVIFS